MLESGVAIDTNVSDLSFYMLTLFYVILQYFICAQEGGSEYISHSEGYPCH